jgi:8-oxo-dGTP diphosphatase
MTPRVVVAAAIIDGGRVLAARRAYPPELAGGWEFPGGKVEPGEDERCALRRECREELGIEVAVGEPLGEADLDRPGWVLRAWLATVDAGTPVAAAHDALRWLAPAELDDVAWLAPDRPIVDSLRQYLNAR